MTAPDWLTAEVSAFGRLLGLSAFGLDAHGLAAVAFENGVKLRLEYGCGALWVQVMLPMQDGAASAERLLFEAHPARNVPVPGRALPCVRAGYLPRTGEGLLAMRLEEGAVDVSGLDSAFRELFGRAVRLGRMS